MSVVSENPIRATPTRVRKLQIPTGLVRLIRMADMSADVSTLTFGTARSAFFANAVQPAGLRAWILKPHSPGRKK